MLLASAHLTTCRIDGRVQSILVGGHDVNAVLKRVDYWYCQFFEYVLFGDGQRIKTDTNSATTTARVTVLTNI